MSSKRVFVGHHLVEEIAVKGEKVTRLRCVRCGLEVPLTEVDKLLSTPCKEAEKALRERPKAAETLKRKLVGGLMGFGVSALGWAPTITLILYAASFILYAVHRLEFMELSDVVKMVFRAEPVNPMPIALGLGILGVAGLFMVSRWLAKSYLIMCGVLAAMAGILSAVSALATGTSTGSAAGHALSELLVMAFTFFVSKLELLYLVIRAWLASNLETILAIAAAMNLLSALAFYVDKRQAEEGGRRIPERSLVRYSVVGGGLGALATALLIRHKTRHEELLVEIAIYTAIFMAFVILAVMGP